MVKINRFADIIARCGATSVAVLVIATALTLPPLDTPLLGYLSVRAHAAEEENRKYADVQTRKRHAVGQVCGKKLEEAQPLIEAERWAQAQTVLESAPAKACQTSYEKSQVWNFLGYVYYSRDRFRDAINAYNKVIAEPETDEQLKTNTRYTVAQLYFMLEDYANAAKYLEQWMRESNAVGVDGKVLLAQAYYQLNRKAEALRYLEQAIGEWEQQGKTPKENWWGLQRVIYYEKKDYRRVVAILKKMIKHYPKYSYWRQLGGMYGELNQDLNQLVAMEIGYLVGNLNKEQELRGLASLFIGAEAPYLAAKVLDKGIKDGVVAANAKNLEMLGQAWQLAQESKRALTVFEQASRLSDKGEISARLASVYLDLGQDGDAVRSARTALNKGGLKRSDLAYMVLGSAQLNLHCYTDARRAFVEAAKDQRSARYAKQWIEYAEREGDRRDRLREGGADLAGCQKA